MSDSEKREVNEILGGITGSLKNLGKDVVDLAKVGADKAQEMVKDYQQKQEAGKSEVKAADDTTKEAAATADDNNSTEETKEDK